MPALVVIKQKCNGVVTSYYLIYISLCDIFFFLTVSKLQAYKKAQLCESTSVAQWSFSNAQEFLINGNQSNSYWCI